MSRRIDREILGKYPFSVEQLPHCEDCEIELLDVLQKMQSMEEISIRLVSLYGVEKLMGCCKLPSLLREFHYQCDGLDSFEISTSMLRRLENLYSISLVACSARQIDISCDYERSEQSLATKHTHMRNLFFPNKYSSFSNLYGFHSLSDVLT